MKFLPFFVTLSITGTYFAAGAVLPLESGDESVLPPEESVEPFNETELPLLQVEPDYQEPQKLRLTLSEAQAAAQAEAEEAQQVEGLQPAKYSFRFGPGLTTQYAASGTEIIRPSLVGADAALERRRVRPIEPYNLKLGPVRFLFNAGVALEYNDNINYSENDEQSDFILRPHIGVRAAWPVTRVNTLRLDIELSYAKYFEHSDADSQTLLISPGSELSFDIFVGDFRINLHDHFSIQQDPIDEPTVTDVTRFRRFVNRAGVAVLWDLNDVLLTLGYDHMDYISLDNEYDYLDRAADAVNFSAAFALRDNLEVGLEGNVFISRYRDDFLNDSTGVHAGVFVDTLLTRYIKVRVSGGYQGIFFDGGAQVDDPDDLNNWYANIVLVHRISPYATYTLTAGHESQLGLTANYIELNFVRFAIAWNIMRDVTLGTEAFFEDGRESGGVNPEHYQRWGLGAAVGYQLARHWRLSARYRFTSKDSNLQNRGYNQNAVIVDATYNF